MKQQNEQGKNTPGVASQTDPKDALKAIMTKLLNSANNDFSQLTPDERYTYYESVCESTGLNPLTKPLDYIFLKGKLTLYAKKDATDQLRKINGISLIIKSRGVTNNGQTYEVLVSATDKEGRTDESIGAVSLIDSKSGQPLTGDDLANAMMKAESKGKRRVTLSLSGLGFLDESEVEDVAGAPAAMLPPDAKKPGQPVQASQSGQPTSPEKETTMEGSSPAAAEEPTQPEPTQVEFSIVKYQDGEAKGVKFMKLAVNIGNQNTVAYVTSENDIKTINGNLLEGILNYRGRQVIKNGKLFFEDVSPANEVLPKAS